MSDEDTTRAPHPGIRAVLTEFWKHSWSDLPPEAERRTEQAFELMNEAEEIVEQGGEE